MEETTTAKAPGEEVTTVKALEGEIVSAVDLNPGVIVDISKRKKRKYTKYTPEVTQKLLAFLANGKPLKTACLEKGMPAIDIVFDWMRKYPDFKEAYILAKRESVDALVEEMLEIADDGKNDTYKEKGLIKTNWDVVERSRLRVETRKWLIGKLAPSRFGDKLDITSDGRALPAPIYGGKATK
jgi:hypothetical protein